MFLVILTQHSTGRGYHELTAVAMYRLLVGAKSWLLLPGFCSKMFPATDCELNWALKYKSWMKTRTRTQDSSHYFQAWLHKVQLGDVKVAEYHLGVVCFYIPSFLFLFFSFSLNLHFHLYGCLPRPCSNVGGGGGGGGEDGGAGGGGGCLPTSVAEPTPLLYKFPGSCVN